MDFDPLPYDGFYVAITMIGNDCLRVDIQGLLSMSSCFADSLFKPVGNIAVDPLSFFKNLLIIFQVFYGRVSRWVCVGQ